MESTRLVRLLVRLHPPAWRRRYGDEVLALVDRQSVEATTVFDLARSAVGEWMRTREGESSMTRAFRTLALTALTLVAGLLVLSLLNTAFGLGLLVATGQLDQVGTYLGRQMTMTMFRTTDAVPGFLAFMLAWCALPAGIGALTLSWTGLATRHPTIARLAVVAVFAFVPVWLLRPPIVVVAVVAAWVFATAALPRTPASRHQAVTS